MPDLQSKKWQLLYTAGTGQWCPEIVVDIEWHQSGAPGHALLQGKDEVLAVDGVNCEAKCKGEK